MTYNEYKWYIPKVLGDPPVRKLSKYYSNYFSHNVQEIVNLFFTQGLLYPRLASNAHAVEDDPELLIFLPHFRVLELQASAALPDLYDTELYLQLSNM